MATLRRVKSLSPIEGADRIETASLDGLGWKVVVPKDAFQPGDQVVFFEVDTFLPESNELFADFMKRGVQSTVVDGDPVTGHVLKTAKLRGVYSQGLILPVSTFGDSLQSFSEGDDVSDAVGVFKFEEELPDDPSIIGSFERKFAPKTLAERIQNLIDHWEEIKELSWDASVKVDGTSQTLVYDSELARFRFFGRGWEIDPSLAKAAEILPEEVLEALKMQPGLTIQFELAGPGISRNRLRLPELQIFIFSVWVSSQGIPKKVPRSQWPKAFLSHATPEIEFSLEGDVSEVLERVSQVRGSVAKGLLDEGVVLHLKDGTPPDWLGTTGTIKFISNAYLAKHKA